MKEKYWLLPAHFFLSKLHVQNINFKIDCYENSEKNYDTADNSFSNSKSIFS